MLGLFDRHRRTKRQIVSFIPRLQRYARALTGDTIAADDLVQECLARALERLDQWQPGTDLRAWLFTLMHNLFVSQYRQQSRQPETCSLEQLSLPAAGASLAEQDRRLLELERALDQLPVEQREVLLLVTLEGMSYNDVAQVLGIARGTVMSRLHRARERLRTGLEGETRINPGLRRVK